jgi:hypothetical protein
LTITQAGLDAKFRYLYGLSSMNNGTTPTISAETSNMILAKH